MAKYKATPHYTINTKIARIQFDYFGNYETSDKEEIAILDKNVPRYVTKISEDDPKKEQPKAEDKPKAQAKQTQAKRKPTAK